jgi:hypothetical protein
VDQTLTPGIQAAKASAPPRVPHDPTVNRRPARGLVAGVGGTRRAAQIDVLVDQLPEHEPFGQGGGQDEPGVGDRVVVVEADRDRVGAVG